MYRSCLLINVGDNPDRPRPGRIWLRNLYHVHQRLCMAFPSIKRKECDPHFLNPFKPEHFGDGQVHVTRNSEAGFLFRIDPQPGGRVVIVVQSALKPDWDYAFGLKEGVRDERGRPIGNAGYLLAAPPQVAPFTPRFMKGDRLRFQIRIGLSEKKKTSTNGADLRKCKDKTDKYGRQKCQSKRVALTWSKDQNRDDVIREWFAKRGQVYGFEIEPETFRVVQVGWGYGLKPENTDESNPRRMKFRSALLKGTLTVTDAAEFYRTMIRGIGPGKAFGFGLLSVAPCHMAPSAEVT